MCVYTGSAHVCRPEHSLQDIMRVWVSNSDPSGKRPYPLSHLASPHLASMICKACWFVPFPCATHMLLLGMCGVLIPARSQWV